MGLFDFLKGYDINTGIKEFEKETNAVLIDVRTANEFKSGHIDKAINIPLDTIEKINNIIKDKNTVIYTYCLSGSRSSRACEAIKSFGYSDVKNIGGISAYAGKKVR